MHDLKSSLNKLTGRKNIATANQAIDVLFNAASEKMQDVSSKEILENLKKVLNVV